MTTRVLILPRHDVQAASCRHRFVQYLPYLSTQDFETTVVPFFDARYTKTVLTTGRKDWWRLGTALLRRVRALVSARHYDLVVIHAELVPYLPAFLEQALANLATPFVLDFDDAFFHQYDQHQSPLVRRLLGRKLAHLMSKAALNIAGSDYLARYARRFSSNVEVVPTVVDLDRYPSEPVPTDSTKFRIGWIGSPSTTPHLQSVMSEIREFCRGRDVEILAIGARPFAANGIPIRWVEWSDATEVQELSRADVGIMPLPDTAWAAGKCGFKLIQAMACWRPVIASPIGANRDIVTHGVSGLHAAPGEWTSALERLYVDRTYRERLGAEARRRVDDHYSLQVWAPRLGALWKQAACASTS